MFSRRIASLLLRKEHHVQQQVSVHYNGIKWPVPHKLLPSCNASIFDSASVSSLVIGRNHGFFANPFNKISERSAQWIPQRKMSQMKLAKLERECVVPDVLDYMPKYTMDICYGECEVDYGEELTPTQVKDCPSVKWPYEEGHLYTLIMTDPDAPCREKPVFREWHHWLVVNIPNNVVSEADTMSEYIGAGPPCGTGLHRYVFVIFEQRDVLNCIEKRLTSCSGDGRGGFSTYQFACTYQLGTPHAANFFVAKYDDYVPILYKKLGVEL